MRLVDNRKRRVRSVASPAQHTDPSQPYSKNLGAIAPRNSREKRKAPPARLDTTRRGYGAAAENPGDRKTRA